MSYFKVGYATTGWSENLDRIRMFKWSKIHSIDDIVNISVWASVMVVASALESVGVEKVFHVFSKQVIEGSLSVLLETDKAKKSYSLLFVLLFDLHVVLSKHTELVGGMFLQFQRHGGLFRKC